MTDNAWGIKIGDFHSENQAIPVYFPLNNRGYCLHFDDDAAMDFLENIALYFATEFPLGQLHVHLFDYRLKKRFPFLSDLKEFGIFHLANNPETAAAAFQNLENISNKRHQEFLGKRTPNLRAYNLKSDYPEPYHLVLINLDDFPDQRIDLKRVQYFVEAAAEAGVFLLGFTSNPPNEEKEEARAWLRSTLLPIGFENQVWKLPEQVFPYPHIAGYYDFQPLVVDKDNLLDELDAAQAAAKTEDTQPNYLEIPIGTTLDGNRPAFLTLGEKTGCHHILLTGSTGSGKTALLNNLILRIGERYNSNEFRLYLMDYKQGVEFQAFQDHPNVEQIYLDNSDIAAAENMLKVFCQTCAERSALFQQVGVSNLADYNKKCPDNPQPRKLLIIDEFQVMFGGGHDFDNWERRARLNGLLAMVARQGRSFGVHLLLTTQSLLDVHLNDETRAQIGLRMTFRLNDAQSARTVLQGDNYDVPLQLGQYQLLYNHQAGLRSGNQIIRTNAPENISDTIARIRASRPPELCLTPQIMTSQKKATTQTGSAPPANFSGMNEGATFSVPNDNQMQQPHVKAFDTIADEALLAKLKEQEKKQ